MKKFAFTSVLIIIFLTISCDEESQFEKYEGAWVGTYSGGDNGSWNVNIDEDGNVSGIAASDSAPGFPFDLNGSVTEDGKLEAQIPFFLDTLNFEGQFTNTDASGNWFNINQGITGTWTGKKK